MKDKQLTFLILIIIGIGIFAGSLYVSAHKINLNVVELVKRKVPVTPAKPQYKETIKLTSTAFDNEGKIPAKFTCLGEDVNPPLTINNLPSNAKSLVLFMDDPDAPYKTWTHWVVYNIDVRQKEIPANTLPWNAKLGTSDYGSDDYHGPCPPVGKHRYYFRLYALDKSLELDKGAKREEVEKAMAGSVIDTGVLMGVFEK